MNSRTERLRTLLAEPGLLVLPGCHDAISARIMERAGFPVAFMSGLAVSAARIGAPDTGLISFGEMLDQGRDICQAVSIPVIGDGDTGYGNALNVKRTVAGYAGAGFAAGHDRGPGPSQALRVCRLARSAGRGPDGGGGPDPGPRWMHATKDRTLLVLGRTDAATTMGIEEGLWRAKAYQDAGCDIVYVEGAESASDLEKVARAIALPKMYVTVEGVAEQKVGAEALEQLGFKLMLWAATLLNVSVRGDGGSVRGDAGGAGTPSASSPGRTSTGSPALDEYYAEEEERYRTPEDVARSES